MGWPSHIRSTPELDRLRAQLAALMPYRTAAEVLGQVFPVDAGADPETLRRHTFKIAEALPAQVTMKPPPTGAEAIVVTLDSTFIRSCEAGERRLGLCDVEWACEHAVIERRRRPTAREQESGHAHGDARIGHDREAAAAQHRRAGPLDGR